jgi:hypothetical protein
MTHANVSNSSSHLNSTSNSTSDALQMKNASKIVERGVFVVMFDSKVTILEFLHPTILNVTILKVEFLHPTILILFILPGIAGYRQ